LYTYDHPRAANTVDIVIIKKSPSGLQILLILRANEPFIGNYALPGGFVDQNETIKDAALRELEEETGITEVELQQIHTFSDPGRDPRGWVISTAYGVLLDEEHELSLSSGSDAAHAAWFDILDLPPLAFDHEHIINTTLLKLGLVKHH